MRGYVLEDEKAKLVWDFDFSLQRPLLQGDQIWYLRARRSKRFGFVI